MIIGHFLPGEDSGIWSGTIDTLQGRIEADMYPVAALPDGITARGVDYVLLTPAEIEIGVAWKRTSRDGRAYISVKLDSPFLIVSLDVV